MLRRTTIVIGCIAALSCASRQEEGAGSARLNAFLRTWEEAQNSFINGDPTLWKQNASQSDDATIFGAFGGHERGWSQVGARYDWAADQHKESGAKKLVEYLNVEVSGDLAFTVGIERDEVLVVGQSRPEQRALRVTQVFRREGGAWKLLHRHADPLLDRRTPAERP